MWRTSLGVVMVLCLACPPCGCGSNVIRGNADGGSDGGGDGAVAALVITPDPADLEVAAGGPPATQVFTATATVGGSERDVSAEATWSIDDAALGAMSGRTFSSVTTRGGTTLVRATWAAPDGHTLAAQAVLNLRFKAALVNGCAGCPAFPPESSCPPT
jgi:hypothetical protein